MEMQEVEVVIDADGRVQIHVQGVHGTACLGLTADLEKVLGVVESREMTPEAQVQEEVRADNQVRSS